MERTAKVSTPAYPKRVYFFGAGQSEGAGDQANLLGLKGANLHEMTRMGLPVPPGFTITTQTCADFARAGGKFPPGLAEEIQRNLARLEALTGRRFGDSENPLLVSVRSGAQVSMPGMMDTVLNVGLNDTAAQGMAMATRNPRFVYDSYLRLIVMFGSTIAGIDHSHFHEVSNDDHDPKNLLFRYKGVYRHYAGHDWPDDPQTQLEQAIAAAFRSWSAGRAIAYRRKHHIVDALGTAVTIQAMVFGNTGEDSAAGAAFTRNPSTGENKLFGEFLCNAQGRDLSLGHQAPVPIQEMRRRLPEAWEQLGLIKGLLESHFKDVQDFEFTVERKKLHILQTRTAKRAPQAAIRIAVEMANDGVIDRRIAVGRIDPASLDHLLHPSFDPNAPKTLLTTGLPASPGAAVGQLAFTAKEAEERAEQGQAIILVRPETDPADINGMHVCRGILTSTGGMTSHAAVIARGMGKCCVAGASELVINTRFRTVTINGVTFNDKDFISLDGGTGQVFEGQVPIVEVRPSGPFKTILAWADEIRTMRVRANADTPDDAMRARDFGAEGIGLCRTEHMFFGPVRIKAMRQMILSSEAVGREKALAKLLPYQREDFIALFQTMRGMPVTIRLLDPPLHEFLPQDPRDQRALAKAMRISIAQLRRRMGQLREINPMLGHRGDRLAITYPEILAMQVRAIFEAAVECRKRRIEVMPEIMVPLVASAEELKHLRPLIQQAAESVMEQAGVEIAYTVGTMIEVPRAALTAEQIAAEADFFSFGTNDLTQMTFAFSRDDAGSFLPEFLRTGILDRDPFQSLDQSGVGKLVEMAVQGGRRTRRELKCGICGEHAGDPRTIEFCHRLGLDYVSCSPYRIPIARLAAAQAVLKGGGGR